MNKKVILDEYLKDLDRWYKKYLAFINVDEYLNFDDINSFKENNPFPTKLSFVFSFNIFVVFKYFKVIRLYKELLGLNNSLNINVISHNRKYVGKRIEDFKNVCEPVEGHYLDDDQIETIVSDAVNSLVIAGAGSGKTTTILGKVKYLIKVRKVKPEEILVLSFTNSSLKEMKSRIESEVNEKIDVYTFHKLGLLIIKKSLDKNLNIYDGSDFNKFIKDSILDEINNNSSYLNDVISFSEMKFLKNSSSENDFSSYEEYKEFLKINPPTTLKNELVKSYGELEIANFLYKNNINYKYEEKYKFDTTTKDKMQYKPDFYLIDYDIYIEYFGIDENGKVDISFDEKDGMSRDQAYNSQIEWKRNIHKENGTTMIECFFYEKKNGELIDNLIKKLKSYNVVMNPKSNQDIWNDINSHNKGYLDEIANTFGTVINLIKSNNYSLETVKGLSINSDSVYDNLLTLRIVTPIFNKYNSKLSLSNEIDFNDMINLATDMVNSKKFLHNYKYVIVDEYQDISKSRYHLLLSMRNSKSYNLFCVGDDWQSIYRFSGSDIGLFVNFEDYWGETNVSRINKTYRFSNTLSQISGGFVMKNPNQINKSVVGLHKDFFPISMIEGFTEKNCVDFLVERLMDFKFNSSVYFIGRYNFDIDILKNNVNFKYKYNNFSKCIEITFLKRKDLKISFLTVHKSKGLESDYVVVINNKNYGMGFPSKISDISLIDLLLDDMENYPYAEERRLFYVALTRAREKVYLLTVKDNKSMFISELENDYYFQLKNERYECPRCGGKLIRRNGKYGEFYGCVNYPNCEFTRDIKK